MAQSLPVSDLFKYRVNDGLPRLFDVATSAVVLIVLMPAMLVIALAVLTTTGSPIFFRQRRLGLHGKPFMILKFKKFRDALDGSGPHLTSLGDQRMTWLGRILQRTKLDELPQFINVLTGEMALVGPRPESMRFADCFDGRYAAVLRHKPGIFGPNQVLFRHEDAILAGHSNVEDYYRRILFPLKASIDVAYFSRRTFSSDMRLLLSAIIAICGGEPRSEHLVLAPPPDDSGIGGLLPSATERLSVLDVLSCGAGLRPSREREGETT